MSTRASKIIVPILILALGVSGAALLAFSRRAPQRLEKEVLGPLVEVMTAHTTTVSTVVQGYGEVHARTIVEVVPQVAGRIIQIHPALVAGGRIGAGETLATIEPRDYELAVDRAQAAVARASVGLEREQAEALVAREEWDAIHPGEEPSSGLVVREPQIRQSEAELAAARADLAVARLNLERTRITLPFDGIVASESVALGQFASTGRTIATVYGTDIVEVRIPLADRELAWFDVPTRPGVKGPPARVISTMGGRPTVWNGRVVRMEARVDTASRMVPIVINVADPFKTSDGRLPLMPGSFVEVEIQGRTIEDVVPIPRHALRENSSVWLVDGEQIVIRRIEVARTDQDTAYVSSGLIEGDLVVVSTLEVVTDGMTVRAVEIDETTGGAA